MQQIMTALAIDEDSCKKTLQSLCVNKMAKILLRTAAGSQRAIDRQESADVNMEEEKDASAAANEMQIDTSVVSSSQQTVNNDAANRLQDRFTLNFSFSTNQYRINLAIPTLEDEGSGTQKPKQKVVQDRAHTIDAAIIKRMKADKRMEYNQLLTQVLAALSMFQPEPAFVKKRVEKLINDEFLARDQNDRSILVYLP